MKFTFITLVSIAFVLGIITYFALFSGPQIIQPNQTSRGNTQVAPSSTQATSTAFLNDSTNTISSDNSTIAPQTYKAAFSAPYPITWTEGQQQLAITGATLQNGQLTLSVNIQMGPSAQCVPINLRLIADEAGNMQAPNNPIAANFPLAPDGSCKGDPQTAYSESVTFTVKQTMTPFLLSTGDPTNSFFEVETTSAGGLHMAIPQKNG